MCGDNALCQDMIGPVNVTGVGFNCTCLQGFAGDACKGKGCKGCKGMWIIKTGS